MPWPATCGRSCRTRTPNGWSGTSPACHACLDRIRSLEAGDPFFLAAQAAAAEGHAPLNAGEVAALKEKVLALKAAATRSDCPEQETPGPERCAGR